MIGPLFTRALVLILGYAYPAYECYKVVEKNKPEIAQLRFWCQYWILVAVLTVLEIGDTFVSWIPLYHEAKLAFYVYLWYPKTMGTIYVYESFFRPYIAKHEPEIDRNLTELRIRAKDIGVLYCQKAVNYSQKRFFEILQYVAAQSTPRPRPTQEQPQAPRTRQAPAAAAASNRQPTVTTQKARMQLEDEQPSSLSVTSSSQHIKAAEQEDSSSQVPSSSTASAAALNAPKKTVVQALPASSSALKKTISAPETSIESITKGVEDAMQTESAALPQAENHNHSPPSQETVIEEAIRVTRGRLRKGRSGAK